MDAYDIEQEVRRTHHRPTTTPTHLLALFRVKPSMEGSTYAARLRSVIREALKVSAEADFDEDDVPIETLPDFFLSVTASPKEGQSENPAGNRAEFQGMQAYLKNRNSRPWNTEDWIYCFDPDLRAWSWWDATINEEGNICVWIDTRGEAHVPCEELWWAIYVSGAEEVTPMSLEYSSVWNTQHSVGISGTAQ